MEKNNCHKHVGGIGSCGWSELEWRVVLSRAGVRAAPGACEAGEDVASEEPSGEGAPGRRAG